MHVIRAFEKGIVIYNKCFMSTFTEFWKLKEVIVGNVQNYNLDRLDITFKLAYGENFKNSHYGNLESIEVFKQDIIERTQDLENFGNILTGLGVTVRNPKELKEFKTFKTPEFSGVLTPVSCPRDRTIVYGKKIIETAPMCRKRYFENQLLYELFQDYFNHGYTWLSAPIGSLKEERFDTSYWKDSRNFENFPTHKYDIAFDAAHMLKVWKDILFNVSTYNHELWARWMQNLLWDDVNVHKIYQIDDTHIDGKISVLRPWTFLVNGTIWKKIFHYLPEKFHNWDVVYVEEDESALKKRKKQVSLCSFLGECTNVLSIDENTVCISDNAVNTIWKLEKKGFSVIPVKMRHCDVFGGGLHCATLDVAREDEFIDYTK